MVLITCENLKKSYTEKREKIFFTILLRYDWHTKGNGKQDWLLLLTICILGGWIWGCVFTATKNDNMSPDKIDKG